MKRYVRGLRVDPRGLEFAERVPAVECQDCGRIFATDYAIDCGERYGVAPIERRTAEDRERDRDSGVRPVVRRVMSSLLGT